MDQFSFNERRRKCSMNDWQWLTNGSTLYLEEGKHPQLRRVRVIWGIPTGMVNKMAIPALARILATASCMDR